MILTEYRAKESERARIADLMRITPGGRRSVLEIGARDGFLTQLLTERFPEVTALDLVLPDFEIPGVTTVQGDVTRLDFPDNSVDCVFCTEVLEHIGLLQKAADELSRVARHDVVIGVPYRQDTRFGATTCSSCGGVNPAYGHVNTFDERRLVSLFSRLEPVSTSFVWQTRERTNAISAWLMNRAGNSWGTYGQDEPCVHCGARLVRPSRETISDRVLVAAANQVRRLQSLGTRPRPNWIHMVFRKK